MSYEISLSDVVSKLANSANGAGSTAAAGERGVILAEVLGSKYFASGHLPGAVNLPLDALERAAVILGRGATIERDAEIIVYCASATCQNSHIAQRKLTEMGFSNVRVFAGGKAAWTDAGLALVVPSAMRALRTEEGISDAGVAAAPREP